MRAVAHISLTECEPSRINRGSFSIDCLAFLNLTASAPTKFSGLNFQAAIPLIERAIKSSTHLEDFSRENISADIEGLLSNTDSIRFSANVDFPVPEAPASTVIPFRGSKLKIYLRSFPADKDSESII